MKSMLGMVMVVLMVCMQTAFAQGLSRDDRQVDEEATYGDSAPVYGASYWTINGTNFSAGQQLLLRNNLNGQLWTVFFFTNGAQAMDTNNPITAPAYSVSPMTNIGLGSSASAALTWAVDAIGDIDGDGQDEVLLGKTSGANRLKKILFFSDNGSVSSGGTVWTNPSKWVVEGIGLFNTNSYAFKTNTAKQILLRNSQNGQLWTSTIDQNGTQHYSTNDYTGRSAISQMTNIGLGSSSTAALGWTVDAIGDVNGDGKDEALIGRTSGANRLKKILFFGDNGAVSSSGNVWTNPSKWVVEGIGLFNTNSYAFKTNTAKQILLRNSQNGQLWTSTIDQNGTQHYSTNDYTGRSAISRMTNISLGSSATAAVSWVVQAIGDMDGDGKDEVVLTKASGTQLSKKVLFFGDNGTVSGSGPVSLSHTKWVIKGAGRVISPAE